MTHILHQASAVIARLLDLHQDVVGIGIGTAGRVNTLTGDIVFATDNLPGWQGTNLKRRFAAEFNRMVAVDNDANTALRNDIWTIWPSLFSISTPGLTRKPS